MNNYAVLLQKKGTQEYFHVMYTNINKEKVFVERLYPGIRNDRVKKVSLDDAKNMIELYKRDLKKQKIRYQNKDSEILSYLFMSLEAQPFILRKWKLPKLLEKISNY